MQTSRFEVLVMQHAAELKKRYAEDGSDWIARRLWWQQRIVELLDTMQHWLSKLIQNHTVTLSRSIAIIADDELGSYEVQAGEINLAQEQLKICPVSAFVIGGYGRVDVDGPRGKAMLLLCATDESVREETRLKSAEWMLANPKQHQQLVPLTQGTFEQMFVDLFGINEGG
ncbi:hypothetical protein [Rugamonas sp.]|uniref:hypothetical protein n=1 Tax=Rugamonas sp. TaxID=1926287 RepID=UPI0025D639DC|nr:hypothetical protein [Rugamonas sp.]